MVSVLYRTAVLVFNFMNEACNHGGPTNFSRAGWRGVDRSPSSPPLSPPLTLSVSPSAWYAKRVLPAYRSSACGWVGREQQAGGTYGRRHLCERTGTKQPALKAANRLNHRHVTTEHTVEADAAAR